MSKWIAQTQWVPSHGQINLQRCHLCSLFCLLLHLVCCGLTSWCELARVSVTDPIRIFHLCSRNLTWRTIYWEDCDVSSVILCWKLKYHLQKHAARDTIHSSSKATKHRVCIPWILISSELSLAGRRSGNSRGHMPLLWSLQRFAWTLHQMVLGKDWIGGPQQYASSLW